MNTYSHLINIPYPETMRLAALREHLPFPAEQLSDFQKWAIHHLSERNNVLVTAHTGTGKTVPAQFACSYFRKVVYTGPIKALLNQKYRDFCQIFGHDRVGLVTGDIRMNPTAPILITTLECYRNELMNNILLNTDQVTPYHREFDLADVECVIFDEVHWIRDPDRGQAWQESLILTPAHVTILMLSATMSNASAFAQWVGSIYHKPVYILNTSSRIVPLQFKSYNPREKTLTDVNTRLWSSDQASNLSRFDQVDNAVAIIRRNALTPALVVSFSRDQCEQYAGNNQHQFLPDSDVVQVRRIWDRYMWDHARTYQTSPQFQLIERLVLRGVAFHHAGLIPVLKEIVEILMEQRYIHVLYATETFAVGINMPIKTVVLTSLMKPSEDGLRLLRSDEFTQIAGRAGRRGIDTIGTVILLPTHTMTRPSDIDTMMQGAPSPIPARFKWSIHTVMQLMVKADRTREEFLDVYKSFYAASFAYIDEEDLFQRQNREYMELTEILAKIPAPDSISYRRLEEIQLKREMMDLMSPKDRRALERLIQSTPALREWDRFQTHRRRYAELRDLIQHRETEADAKMNRLMRSLIHLEFLTPDLVVTTSGIVASAVQDGNEVLYAKMVRRIDWSHVTVPVFGGLLTMLIDEKYASDDPAIPDQMLPYWRTMRDILRSLEEQITDPSLQEFYGGYSWALSEHYIGPIYDWLSGLSFMEVIRKYPGLFEGSLIRYCLRLRQIMEMMYRIGVYIRNTDLTTLAAEAPRRLIRDEVKMDSLYLNTR